ncbi:MAG TPA: hypothetical protein PLX06_08485 [Fimbriimonadaceae bacterium]|nr:hypothetical protein [Fimbriimonadaceae bacterium]
MTLAICALLAAVNHAPKFDFEQRAASLKVVLQNLSEKSGTPLKAAPAIAEEIVLVVAKGAELEEIKSQIAKALDATWTKASDADYLNRTPAQTREILSRHLAYRRKLVDEALTEIKKPLEKEFDGGSLAAGLLAMPSQEQIQNDPAQGRRAYDEERRLFGNGPAARLIRRLVLACRPQELSLIGPYERAVFRATPTSKQFGFDPSKLDEALKAYSKEQTAWIKAARAVEFPGDRLSRVVSDPRVQLSYPVEVPSSFKLVIRRGDMANLFLVNLMWESDASLNRVVAQLSVDDPMRRFLDAAILPRTPDALDPLVELSQNTQLFNERIMGLNKGALGEPIKPETLELILHPDRFDPLGFGASDGLFAAARHLGKNIVASLSDVAANATWFLSRENPLRLNAFLRAQLDSGALRKEEDGDWWRFVPADLYEASLQFTPRSAIASLTKSIQSKGRLDVRDYASYAYQSKRITRIGLGDVYMMLLDPSTSSGLDRTDWNALRLYGSFDRNAQTRLEQGAQFPYAGLNPEQKRIVDRIVFADEIQSEQLIDANSSRLLGKPIEPTEAFVAGVPPNAYVYARVQSLPVIVAYGKDASGKVKPLRTLNEWTLATIEVDGKGNPEFMNRYGVGGLVGYAMGQSKAIALRVYLAEGVWKESPILVLEPPENPNPVSWDKLPPAVAESIRKSIELKKNPPSTGGTVRPPI